MTGTARWQVKIGVAVVTCGLSLGGCATQADHLRADSRAGAARAQATSCATSFANGAAAADGPTYYVGVGQPVAEGSGLRDRDLVELRGFLEEQLGGLPGVTVAPATEPAVESSAVMQTCGVTGVYLDSSVVELTQRGSSLHASVMLAVGSYPGRELRGVIQGAARVGAPFDAQARAEVIRGALLSAMQRLPAALHAVAERDTMVASR